MFLSAGLSGDKMLVGSVANRCLYYLHTGIVKEEIYISLTMRCRCDGGMLPVNASYTCGNV